MLENMVQTSKTLADVKYEIRGQLAHHVGELIDLSLRALLNPGEVETLLEQHVE